MPLAEKALISLIRRRAGGPGATAVGTGIGDDCAVLRVPAGCETLVTTDLTIEGVHFRREWHPPASVGHRCLARGLSDIAAMGGDPVAAFLSLALPRKLPQAWVDGFLDGLLVLARRFKVKLAGGDVAESSSRIVADIVVIGSVPRGKGILRSGARPEDGIFVSERLGASAAVLREMMKDPKRRLNPIQFPQHFFPEPRLRLGRLLQGKASAMIDLSDGLSTDLAHLCEESGCGAQIQADKIPVASLRGRPVTLDLALHGGEDYELLFTARPRARIPSRVGGVSITRIGEITRRRKIILINPDGAGAELLPRGWEHFKSPK